MRKDALEDYTNRGFSSCLRRLKSENIPEAPSAHMGHRFTYSSVCSKANGQLNLRSFKGRESFGSNISNSAWYFWKELSLCKKLFSWRKEQLMPDTLPIFPDTIVIITILPEQFGIRKAGVELVRKAALIVSVGCAGVKQDPSGHCSHLMWRGFSSSSENLGAGSVTARECWEWSHWEVSLRFWWPVGTLGHHLLGLPSPNIHLLVLCEFTWHLWVKIPWANFGFESPLV